MEEMAADRYALIETRSGPMRRALGWATTLISSLVTEGGHPTNPGTRSWTVVDRVTSKTVGTVGESMSDTIDTGSILEHDLNEMSADRFRQVWLQGREKS